MKNVYILTNDQSEKDDYINIISDRLTKIRISKQNNSIVSRKFKQKKTTNFYSVWFFRKVEFLIQKKYLISI